MAKSGKYKFISVVLVCVCVLTGCSLGSSEEEGTPVDFTVLSKDNVPKEVVAEMEKRGSDLFRFTLSDQGKTYVCVGYGPQQGQGYSIRVENCSRKEDGIYVNTTLIGPEVGKGSTEGISYPYIVLRMEEADLPVIME